jgi:predicted NBD/HSP70 family sugar kinase
MIFNGQLIRGAKGMAGEFGHIVIQESGPLCNCGQTGCLEAFASNTAVVRHFNALTFNPKNEMAQTTFNEILTMAEEGDRNACDSLKRMAHYLGIGVAMVSTGLAPDVVVLVGAVTRVWRQIEPIINAVVQERSVTGTKPRIIAAGPETRVCGAVALVVQRYFAVHHMI